MQKQNNRSADPEEQGKGKTLPVYRFIIVAAVFVFVCVLYSVIIVAYNAGGTADDVRSEEKFTEHIVTVPAVRGEIYDRNGILLVKNNYTYSVVFDYSAMSATYAEQNRDIIRFFGALDKMDIRYKLADTWSPLHGVYPYLTYDEEILSGSVASYRHKRILSELGLKEDASALEVADKLCEKYRMTDYNGNKLYSDLEITDLLRFRYETEAIQFSPDQSYTLLENIGIPEITSVAECCVPGARIAVLYTREYCYPGYASHILGRTGKIFAEKAEYYTSLGYPITATVGLDGCEAAFENYLRGMDGQMKIVRDENGNIVRTEMIKEPEPGLDVYLTIDIRMQIASEEALKENIDYVREKGKASKTEFDGEDCDCGAIVAEKSQTGEVLVIASYPSYNLSEFGAKYGDLIADKSLPLFNRALEGTYAPGSTFKVGIATAALMEKIKVNNGETFTPNTIINTTGVYRYYDDYQPVCWLWTSKKRSHGPINVTTAIQVSCNCFFYEIGRIMGIDTINSYCRRYGLGQPTGIELPESRGVLADSEYTRALGVVWTGGVTIQTAIGQAYNRFTPLQISSYISTVINGGNRWAAHVLKDVRKADGTVDYTYENHALSTVEIDSGTLSVIRNAMSKVIDESTTVTAFNKYPVGVGGKTGTAQVTGQSNNALFVCFAPLDDPEITVSVVLERGATGANGSRAAKKVLDAYFGY